MRRAYICSSSDGGSIFCLPYILLIKSVVTCGVITGASGVPARAGYEFVFAMRTAGEPCDIMRIVSSSLLMSFIHGAKGCVTPSCAHAAVAAQTTLAARKIQPRKRFMDLGQSKWNHSLHYRR